MQGWYLFDPKLKVRVSDYYADLSGLQRAEQHVPGLLVKYKSRDEQPIPRGGKLPSPYTDGYVAPHGPNAGKPREHQSLTPKQERELAAIATRKIFASDLSVTNPLIAKREYQSGLSAMFEYLDRQAALEQHNGERD